MLMHIRTFGQSCPCLQWVNICCVFVGDISFEIKTEADSNDITQYRHDDMPSTGMVVIHYESILCTTFDALPVTPPRYVTRLYVFCKNLWQDYETDNSIV